MNERWRYKISFPMHFVLEKLSSWEALIKGHFIRLRKNTAPKKIPEMDMKKRALYTAVGVAVVFVIVLFVERYLPEKRKLEIDSGAAVLFSNESPKIGNEKAEVLVTNFVDPECSHCARLNGDLLQLAKKYPEQILIQIRYVLRHKNSKLGALALEAAREQGKYWEMLSLLHTNSDWVHKKVTQEDRMLRFATQLGLNLDRFKTDIQSPMTMVRIKKDDDFARSLGVRLGPLVFVGSKSLPVDGFDELDTRVQDELARIKTQR